MYSIEYHISGYNFYGVQEGRKFVRGKIYFLDFYSGETKACGVSFFCYSIDIPSLFYIGKVGTSAS